MDEKYSFVIIMPHHAAVKKGEDEIRKKMRGKCITVYTRELMKRKSD